eukprot:TRINITY_DN18003_c0_g1_i2.p1 TRINITY_DN18003_c0_g1~~TRINITY_DN18003_c0_g1_i2.p1  ORF type:complete len:216 (+),score=57.00 TRINITY_DN18003_c0_g1_i2:101-748(+)
MLSAPAGSVYVVYEATKKNKSDGAKPELVRAPSRRVGKIRRRHAEVKQSRRSSYKRMSEKVAQYDTSDSGALDRLDLQALLEDLNDGKPVMKEELDFFFSVNDTSGDGKIGPDELPAVLETWKSHIHSIPEVRTIFEKFDKNRDGHLQKEELRKLLIELNDGEDVEDEELDYVLEEADLMENGVISIIELKRAIAFWYHNVELKERKKSRFCTLL